MTPRPHPILLLVLLALLAAKAVIPTGWMPLAANDGVRITLCTGEGMVAATLDAQGHVHPGEPADEAPRDICPYATLALAADLPTPAMLAAAPLVLAEPPLASTSPHLVATLHAPRPPTRGPPALA